MAINISKPQQDILQDFEGNLQKNSKPMPGHLFSHNIRFGMAAGLSTAITIFCETGNFFDDMGGDIGQHARALAAGAETFGLLAGAYYVSSLAVNFVLRLCTGNPATHYPRSRMLGMVLGMGTILYHAVPVVYSTTAKLFDNIEEKYEKKEVHVNEGNTAQWSATRALQP